jgi:hypothetical protein
LHILSMHANSMQLETSHSADASRLPCPGPCAGSAAVDEHVSVEIGVTDSLQWLLVSSPAMIDGCPISALA